MDRIRPQQTPGMRWAGKSTSLGHKPPVFCNRTGFSVCTRCGTDILRHVLALRPYDTLFLLSSRQTVTSIASALMWLISLLFQNQAFNRARTLGIHLALIISRSNECLTMP